jgi:bifunctional DNA primase/polymerase-like protein
MNQQPNGITLVAVDIDVKNGGTFNALTQNRCWSTATASAIIPSGGTHFLLRLPGNQLVRTRIGMIKGVDLIGEGSLIVVEPPRPDRRWCPSSVSLWPSLTPRNRLRRRPPP